MTESVRIERDGPVWTITLSRPERRNAVDGPTAALLADAFREFDAAPEASVAILYGEGGTFCAGADLKEVGGPDGNVVVGIGDGDGPMGPSRMRLSKPVIAAVEGFAVAGGLELAVWCDLRVAAEDAVFGVLCRRWGVPLIDGGTVRLPALIGVGRALDLVLSGREVGAREALAIGLVNRLAPARSVLAVAQGWAAELSKLPQVCMRTDRQALLDAWGIADEAQALAIELEYGKVALGEVTEGLDRFRAGAGRHGQPL